MIVGFFPSASPSVTSRSHLYVIRTPNQRVNRSWCVGRGRYVSVYIEIHVYIHTHRVVQRGAGTQTDKGDTEK